MNNFFNKAFATLTSKVFTPFGKYLSTPIGKITMANSVLFVNMQTHSCFGTPKDSLRTFFPTTLPLRGSI